MAPELSLLTRVAWRDQEITGPQLRGLLALLADHLVSGCGTTRLIDALWPDRQPQHPSKALQILVSRARADLGAHLIEKTASGYRLNLTEEQVDATAVRVHADAAERHARAGEDLAALAEAEAGLALWAAPPTDGTFADDPLAVLRAARVPIYRSLERSRALALSRLGRHAEARPALDTLAARRPEDEEILAALLRSEAATTGTPAALRRYEDFRRRLRDDLGSDPGPTLRQIHRELIGGEAHVTRHNVPHEPNMLLGRDDDIAAVTALLRTARVTSIVGPGGLGKTRLAYAVARRAEQPVVYVVPLAGVTADHEVAAEVASALGVGESRQPPVGPRTVAPGAVSAIAAALGPGPGLLVLDNCEQVVQGVADLVNALVSMTRDLRVLTTSRTPLGLSSESVHPLPELALPAAVELFTQRARAARPGAALPADAVADLCRHLDGLPLAVELAAARVRVMTVPEITRRLDDRFALLRGGARDAPQRHHTLHAVVDWSWALLRPSGQAAMRALSIFPGGFDAAAARRLLGHDDVLTVLEHLVDQSLLKVEDTPAGVRFRMLETVREFAAARRDEADETEQVISDFLGWARDFGVSHHESLLGAAAFTAAELIRTEQDNLVLALRYGLARCDGGTVAATSAVLAGLWTLDANYPRMLTLTDETAPVLSHFRPEPPFLEVTRTTSVLAVAHTFMMLGPRATRALVTLRRLPPPPPGTLIGALATVLCAVPEMAVDPAALLRFCDHPEPLVAGVGNCLASYVFEQSGQPEHALAAARRMLGALADRPVPWIRVLAHSRVGELCMQAELGEEARGNLTAALNLLTESGPWLDVLQIRWALVLVNLQLGAVDEAERWLALATYDRADDAYRMRSFETGVRAEVALARGDVEAGLRLWRAAVDQLATPLDPLVWAQPDGDPPWILEVRAAAVVAHARRGGLDAVEKLVDDLSGKLAALLARPLDNPPAFLAQLPICGAMLLALAMVDLERGDRTGDEQLLASGARLIALAERFGCLRNFQPSMSSAAARRAAEQADRAAYDEASASYAALGHDDLRAAALTALRARPSAGQRDGSRSYSLRAHR
ncbi:Predicted ATPase [Micromonospora rhizosphaerae]|uniref:Predicted ATPase n=1 Tax=Micromonospora rhizosphaerae TaxID=568872 RepID=A0A1C6STY7_9ACTN|nr:BTAD domain-containing putative transcriptional regulator [Micromonospora rhizosphaerae]SCL32980.1 Predicted ATPase [Micromonospora rhizosphaerae]